MSPAPSFEQFFQAIHGYAPYPWQARLCRQVVRTGAWPKTLDVPTGAGKTATLDIAVYALMAEATKPRQDLRAPRRIAMVVDRRTIVDQSFDRACAIRDKLLGARDGPLRLAADRLRSLMGCSSERLDPLTVTLLRGGVPRDDGWARRPDQPLIVLSTVDQVGSRLLFRGYGVSNRMRSLHAGLLGHDTLFLLDEVHLARPFQQTLASLADRDRAERTLDLPDRWQVVALSATSAAQDAFGLAPEDRALPRLNQRLTASKPVTLHAVDSSTHARAGGPARRWISGLVAAIRAHLDQGAACLGVVVNRVDTAAAVAVALEADGQLDVCLVTGRMRPADRAEVTEVLRRRAGPGWTAGERPFVCVATQCIEAGADLDFDALVTEVAALDALVQRFGRANRTGDRDSAPVTVLAPEDVADDDPIYGASRGLAWSWLQSLGEDLDASTAALEPLLAAAPRAALAPSPVAPVVLPAHLDLLTQTEPTPHPSPDPALYLKGLDPPRPEVSVVWRADVDLEAVGRADARLAAVPPTTHEALQLPLGVARQWLAGRQPGSFGDVGGGEVEGPRLGRKPPVAFRWTGEGAVLVTADQIHPGATLVVSAARGGLARGNFAPAEHTPVTDVGDLGRTLRSGRAIIRLDVVVHPDLAACPAPPARAADDRTLREEQRLLAEWVDACLASTVLAQGATRALLQLVSARGFRASSVDGVWVLRGRHRLEPELLLGLARQLESPTDAPLTATEASWVSEEPVDLAHHLEGVGAWARSLAEACGLPESVAADLERAGRWHDLGKAHPRFQVLLYGGDEIRAAGGPLLAKSAGGLAAPDARRRAWERSALPAGFRHEMASLALLTSSPQGRELLGAASDPELVLHLVASHHGFARPFAPVERHDPAVSLPPVELSWDGVELVAPGDHRQDRLDSGVAARFWRLQRRYGRWGLAWLEAILRLADHRESEAEEQAGGRNSG